MQRLGIIVRRCGRLAQNPAAELVLLATYATVLGLLLRPNVSIDDAAITFRYVDRLTSGHGFTYNDHEHVLGTSNPLYALTLAVVTLVSRDVESAAAVVGLAAFVGSVLLAYRLTRRISGSRLAAIAAGVLLATDPVYRYQCLNGMESCLAALLALSTADAVLDERETAAGIFLGLAVWNKLDAALLALAVTASWVFARRRLPLKLAATSAAVVAPWLLFAAFYYGSPIPHSLTAKLYLQPRTNAFDHLWVWSFLKDAHHVLFAIVTVLSLGGIRLLRLRRGEENAVVLLSTWFLFHFTALSMVDLGDRYPWYLTVLMPPMIIVTCAILGRLFVRSRGTRYAAPVAVGSLVVLWLDGNASVAATRYDLEEGNPIKPWEAFDDDRRLAGVFLNQYAGRDEILSNAYGWPAYASGMRFNDISLLNSVEMLNPTTYMVEHGYPPATSARGPGTPAGFIPLATFNLASDLYPGYSWFTLFGRPDSYIARIGARYLQYRLYELPAPSAYSAESGLEHVKLAGKDLLAHPPSGATFVLQNANQPVHVVFAPGFVPGTPVDKTDGVTFELRIDDRRFYRRHVLATEHEEPVIVEAPEAQRRSSVRISLVTETGPRGDPAYDWAVWQGVKLVVGDAFVDVWKLGNDQSMKAWSRHNATGVSSRGDQIGRVQARAR